MSNLTSPSEFFGPGANGPPIVFLDGLDPATAEQAAGQAAAAIGAVTSAAVRLMPPSAAATRQARAPAARPRRCGNHFRALPTQVP